MNILDYVRWRGDLTFEERSINVIDSLIFSELAYENFDEILNNYASRTLKDCAQLFFSIYDEDTLKNRKTLTYHTYELLREMSKSKRYQDLILTNYVNEIDMEQNLQFSAMCIEYKDQWKYIAYRGTDDTLTGWKEDFMMTYKEEVLSQKKAVEYIKMIVEKDSLISKLLNRNNYYLGGHSKGGNLAMYASIFAPNEIQKRIKRIDNFDGPGFEKGMWNKEEAQKMIPLIHTYIPTSSVFGRIFSHPERVKIVKSNQKGLAQHDGFSWFIDVDKFEYEDELSYGSDKAISKLNQILEEYDLSEREEMVESLFSIFDRLEIHTLTDMTTMDANRIIKALKEIHDLDNKQRKILMEIIQVIWDVSDILPIK